MHILCTSVFLDKLIVTILVKRPHGMVFGENMNEIFEHNT
jgi:hypothetical protein